MKEIIEIPGLKLHLGQHATALHAAIAKAKSDDLVQRIWAHDHRIWNPEPTEISNRLGWLDVAERMRGDVVDLNSFASELKASGYTHALLLGMGGSSLAPEVYSLLLGSKDGLHLEVLYSTDPHALRSKAKSFDPKKTIYIVSSKSGGTVETVSFFKYFYNQVQETVGKESAGAHFAAITDPGSGLAKLAEEYGFRKIFLADPNIGGRYSALTHFGLVPAALVGVDLARLLDGAVEMSTRCKAPVDDNLGALLGLAMGTLAAAGSDKLTFLAPDAIASFGDWAEQLIAESTGKQGHGVLPVVSEPLLSPADYSTDRVFAALGLGQGHEFASAGLPLIETAWDDNHDLGAQFFLWEFATAVAGYVLAINPFDQPDVEAAKIQARHFIDEYRASGTLPKGDIAAYDSTTLDKFLAQGKPGDYIALQAYAAHTPALHAKLQGLRAELLKKYKLATTLGYGPRFLHSTGQLHKGDGGHGLFVQLISPIPADDVAIPTKAGAPESEMSFGVLKQAQALGDAQALRQAGKRVISFEIDWQ
jgi:glucose-6-phosphate isomerase